MAPVSACAPRRKVDPRLRQWTLEVDQACHKDHGLVSDAYYSRKCLHLYLILCRLSSTSAWCLKESLSTKDDSSPLLLL